MITKHAAFALTLLAACQAFAHHSPAAFDVNRRVSIRGEVSRYIWRNPHVYIYVNGTDDSGTAAEWQIEGDPTPLMSRSGWSASTLESGDFVSLVMHPDRDTTRRHGLLATLTTAGGQTFGMRTELARSQASTNTIAGVWDALPRFPGTAQIYNPNRAFTRAGSEARAVYDDSLFPPSECLTFPTPAITLIPYLNEIEILEDRVLIESEFYSTDRVIYTDGRRHPVNGERTIQGHSIGRWEGTTLVVDTRLFADYRIANGPGVPSGAQKHTVERFQLSEKGTELEIEITVEDPEYVVEPFTVSAVWVYAPDRRLQRFDCDPENARSFYLQ